MKRLSPAVICLLVVAGFVFLADAVIVVVPAALAEPAQSVPVPTSVPVTARPTVIALALPVADPTDDVSLARPQVAVALPTPTPIPSPTAKPTPVPTPRDTVWNARTYVKNRIGAKQYDCINAVWTGESKWNPRAGDPAGAYGIPQAFPGSKMAAFGSNWRYSPLTQVKWGLWYVNSRYGSACSAYTFWKANGWY